VKGRISALMGDKSGEGHASDVILAAAPDGVLVVDEHNVVRYCNPAAEKLLGRAAGSLAGSRFGSELMPGRADELEVSLPGEARRVLGLRVSATVLNGVTLRVASMHDVTEHKQAEHSLTAALERQGEALAAADELRSPLAEIDALARVLADDQVRLESAERLTVAARVADDASRLRYLTGRLLASAQTGTGAAGPGRSHPRVTRPIAGRPTTAGRAGTAGTMPARPAGPEPAAGQEPALTIREREVLELMGQGLDPAAIAERLVVSVHTARGHVKNVMMKLGAHTQLEAVVTATRMGLLAVHEGP
jgi:DNA-binding CsgD family transcriptional regulator